MGARRWIAVAAAPLVLLAGCTSSEPSPPDTPAAPRPIPTATAAPGEPLVLKHAATAGEVVQVWITPLTSQDCPIDLTLESPSGEEINLRTHDPIHRLDEDGTWTWTYEPCPDTPETLQMSARGTLDHALEIGGPAVDLATHATYDDAATFEAPAQGRVILLGASTIIGPDGSMVIGFSPIAGQMVIEDGRLASEVSLGPPTDWPEQPPFVFTAVARDGGGQVRVLAPVEVEAEADGEPVQLQPGESGAVEYAASFSVDDDLWLSARLDEWADTGDERPVVEILPVEGDDDPERVGGLWHLTPGDYTARVSVQDPEDSGTLTLSPLTPEVIDGPGTIDLSTGADGEPAMLLYDVDETHPVRVAGGPHTDVPWLLVFGQDEAPPPCVSVISCASARAFGSIPLSDTARAAGWKPRVTGEGYLILRGEPDTTITVRIGR